MAHIGTDEDLLDAVTTVDHVETLNDLILDTISGEPELEEPDLLGADQLDALIQTLNLSVREFLASVPCRLCGQLEGRRAACGYCGEAYHLACAGLERQPSIYWNCPSCSQEEVGEDPARDKKLIKYLRGFRDFPPPI